MGKNVRFLVIHPLDQKIVGIDRALFASLLSRVNIHSVSRALLEIHKAP